MRFEPGDLLVLETDLDVDQSREVAGGIAQQLALHHGGAPPPAVFVLPRGWTAKRVTQGRRLPYQPPAPGPSRSVITRP